MSDAFVKLPIGGPGSLQARSLAAYVRYRCWASDGGWTNREIAKAEIRSAMGMTDWQVREGLKEARKLKLVATVSSSRPGAPSLFIDPARPDPQEDASRPHDESARGSGRHPPHPAGDSPDPQETSSRPRAPSSQPQEAFSRSRPSVEEVDQEEQVEKEEAATPPSVDPDERIRRHRERLEAEKRDQRETASADPVFAVTREHIAAVRGVSDTWSMELESDTWKRRMGEAIRREHLTPEHVSQILAAWDAQVESLGGLLKAGGRIGKGGEMPDAWGIWWDCWRSWRASALGIDAPKPKPRWGAERFDHTLEADHERHRRRIEAAKVRYANTPERDVREIDVEMHETAAVFDMGVL